MIALTHCYLVMLEAANAVRLVSALPHFTPDSSDTGCFQGNSVERPNPKHNLPPVSFGQISHLSFWLNSSGFPRVGEPMICHLEMTNFGWFLPSFSPGGKNFSVTRRSDTTTRCHWSGQNIVRKNIVSVTVREVCPKKILEENKSSSN